jgi:exopolysaccharide biosynthesis polyprenyl glycosylphosphotransferase
MNNPLLVMGALRFDAARTVRRPKASASGVQWRQRYQWLLRITDAALITLAVIGSAQWMQQTVPPRDWQAASHMAAAAAGVGITWFLMSSVLRTRDPQLIGVGSGEYKRVVGASAATFGVLAVTCALLELAQPRLFFLVAWPVGLAMLLAGRWFWRGWLTYQRRFGHYLSNVVVVGQHPDVYYVVSQLLKKSGAAYDVVGVVLEGNEGAPALQVDNHSVPVVGSLDGVREAVRNTGADAVLIAGSLQRGSAYIRELGWELEKTSTELVVASALTNVSGSRLRLRPVEGLPLTHVDRPAFSGWRHAVKRALDIVLSGCALLALAPLIGVLVLLIKSDSTGPGFFAQDRVGKGGRTFRMYKLRSMVTSAEAELQRLQQFSGGNKVLFKMRNDPRVTRVGRWIRRYSLDELPQLYNVLRGDMSLVGPRPPLAKEVAQYEHHTHRRLYIKPGCTGLWQINGRSDLDWDESVRLDLYYVENWSVMVDLGIMWRTVKVMLLPKGAY